MNKNRTFGWKSAGAAALRIWRLEHLRWRPGNVGGDTGVIGLDRVDGADTGVGSPARRESPDLMAVNQMYRLWLHAGSVGVRLNKLRRSESKLIT
jgi:hypothetical protein